MTMTIRNLIHYGGILFILFLAIPLVQATAVSGVQIFPQDHVWNVPADHLPVDARSADYIKSIGTTNPLHPDFGADLDGTGPFGIPYNIVDNTVTKKTVLFDYD